MRAPQSRAKGYWVLNPLDSAAAARLRAAADRFATRVGHWSPQRWARAPEGSARSRADRVHAVALVLADLCADAEVRPRRPVPRLENDLALLDQVRVLVADLLIADPAAEVLDAATAALHGLDLT